MSRSKAVTFKGTPLTLAGNEVKDGQAAPDFKLNYFEGGMKEIRQGEVWRFITPILIHFPTSNILIAHILFNMLWLRDIGCMFEARLGWWYLVVFVLVTVFMVCMI